MGERTIMPIMSSILMSEIPWALIAPHEAQARANHGQSLNELARRGGLAPCEALAILDGKPYNAFKHCDENAIVLINRVRAWRAATASTNTTEGRT